MIQLTFFANSLALFFTPSSLEVKGDSTESMLMRCYSCSKLMSTTLEAGKMCKTTSGSEQRPCISLKKMKFTRRARRHLAVVFFSCLLVVGLFISTSSCHQTIGETKTSGTRTKRPPESNQRPLPPVLKSKKPSAIVSLDANLSTRLASSKNILVKQQKQQQQQQRHYGIIVDCGSSGTRATIYTWPAGIQTGELAYKIEALHGAGGSTNEPVSIRIRPGLASVRSNPNYASEYMRPIMEFASRHVPPDQQAGTPVYIMGTAGMRLLTQQERQSIIDDLNRDLRLEFSFQEIRPEVISGVDEGVYQWVSVNALAARLTPQFDLASSTSPAADLAQLAKLTQPQHRQARRLGMIEMGGASAQVAFEVNPAMLELLRRRLKHQGAAWRLLTTSGAALNLYGDAAPDVSVFSVSFLGFGSDSVRALATDLLVRYSLAKLAPFVVRPADLTSEEHLLVRQANSSGPTIVVDDPCLPLGAEETVTKPLELLHGQSKSIGYELASDRRQAQEALTVRLVGKGNYALCQVLLNRLASLSRCEQTTCNAQLKEQPCEAPLIGTNFVPWQQLQWLGLGELYYTPHVMFNASSESPFNLPLMRLRTARLCSTSWQDIQTQYEAESEFERRRNLLACFKATWIITWLATILRMPPSANDLRVVAQINGMDVDWKLGAIITKTVKGG